MLKTVDGMEELLVNGQKQTNFKVNGTLDLPVS